jgi:hypothetical protein
MKRLRILGIIACVGLLFAPAAVIGDPAGPPGGLDVNVVNPLPLPVGGDVNVANTPDVNVVNQPTVKSTQEGTWDVNCSGEMIINGDESSPIPVQSPYARKKYAINMSIPFPVDETERESEISGTLWANYPDYYYVIEYVSARSELDASSGALRYVLIDAGDRAYFAPQEVAPSPDGDRTFIISQQTALIVRPGTTIDLKIYRTEPGGIDYVWVTLTGYLVPEDSPTLSR